MAARTYLSINQGNIALLINIRYLSYCFGLCSVGLYRSGLPGLPGTYIFSGTLYDVYVL